MFLGSTPFIALKPSQILWSAILNYNCSWRLNWIWQDSHFALHKKFHAIRYIWNETLCRNLGLITFYSDSRALISHQTWFRLTPWKYLRRYITVHRKFFYYFKAQQRETIHDKMPKPKPKFGLEPWVLDSKSKLSRFVYIRGHVTLQLQSNAEKVNSSLQLWLFYF